jgi:hypothetical protein
MSMGLAHLHGVRTAAVGVLCAVLAACQHTPPQPATPPNVPSDAATGEDDDRPRQQTVAVPATAPGGAFAGWLPRPLPAKRWVDFEAVTLDGVAGLQVQAQGSLSLLHLTVEPARTDVKRVAWSWWLERELPDADLAQAEVSDSPVRLLLAFDGDRSRLTGRQAMVSELVRLMTGHELPYATLTYVWTRQYPPGTVLHNPRTDRIRYLVVAQGRAGLGRWLRYERDVQADFVRAFGEPPGPLMGVGLMTDTDNTQSSTRVVYGPVTLRP